MKQVQDVCTKLGLYLLNSLNPFRLEGQKTIMLRIIEGLGWEVPDWIVVPGGNLGNSSAFGKAFYELKQLGLIKLTAAGDYQRNGRGYADGHGEQQEVGVEQRQCE